MILAALLLVSVLSVSQGRNLTCADIDCPGNTTCHECKDGSLACMNSTWGQCCSCKDKDRCWACPLVGQCSLDSPFVCKKLTAGAIVGIVLAVLLLFALSFVYWYRSKEDTSRYNPFSSDSEEDDPYRENDRRVNYLTGGFEGGVPSTPFIN
eukprot:TRINITY_DN1000_c0_g1_i3.p1 TRINITY_DN1000_c0_g1~~TRINITY_DN1000_c0_g1_i3.p1  ORF type:complete len:167 (-),score=33.17 TRINITY_DN1000_c0_g1_i3:145-600(-)